MKITSKPVLSVVVLSFIVAFAAVFWYLRLPRPWQVGELACGKPIIKIWKGTVTQVNDGDSIKILNSSTNQDVSVQLEGIDAPELDGQPFGIEAKDRLAELIMGHDVTVLETGRDSLKRSLAVIVRPNLNVNHKMVIDGMAWHSSTDNDSQALATDQLSAEVSKRGLWSSELDPIAPWHWRQRQ